MSFSITPRGGAFTARGGWNLATTFYQDDFCIWQGIEYQSLLPVNIGNQPDISPWAWVPTSVGDINSVAANESPWGVNPDTRNLAFDHVTGNTVTFVHGGYLPTASDVGLKTCLPGCGADDGFGVKDGFTTTITGFGIDGGGNGFWTLTDPVTTNVIAGGSNNNLVVGTDWTTQLQAFGSYVATTGKKGVVPPGNIMVSDTLNFGTWLLLNTNGMRWEAAGSGSVNVTASSATVFCYVGPNNASQGAGANGCGKGPFQAAVNLGRNGLKIKGFGVRNLRALNVSGTINGVFTLTTVPSGVTVAGIPVSAFPAFGRAIFQTAGGTIECQYTGVNAGTNQLTGCVLLSGSQALLNGGTVRSVVASFYWDFIANSHAEDVITVGYRDNNDNITNQNSGIGVWGNNFSSGYSTMERVHARYFNGANEAWRVGTNDAGYGVRGNGGNCTFTACTGHSSTHGLVLQGPALTDGLVFNSFKVTVSPGINPQTGYAYWLQSSSVSLGPGSGTGRLRGPVFNGPHAEGGFNGMRFDGCCGAVVNGPLFTNLNAVQNAGSVAFNFVNGAQGNIVNGGSWGGWLTAPGSGTPGFDYGAQFDSTSVGNIVTTQIDPNFPFPGVGNANVTNSQNRYVDLSNPPSGDAGSGQQQGMLFPDYRSAPRTGSNVTLVANQAYFMRGVPTRPIIVTRWAVNVSTAAGTVTDLCDFGIYLWNGTTFTKIHSTGGVAKLGVVGMITQLAAFTLLPLPPGQCYYAAFACGPITTTAAVVQGLTANSNTNFGFFGSAAGFSECGQQAGAYPLPAVPAPTWNQGPVMLAAREV